MNGPPPEAAVPALEARLTVTAGDFTVTSEVQLREGVLVFFGPSGAGKTLTLQALAGLLRPREGFLRVRGEWLFDSERRVDVPAHRRRIGYVPQAHALLPFLDVVENVRFGLPRRERRADNPRIRALFEELGLAHLAHARPPQLSGGERQRVALARALAVQPRLLLLDEPFASIDREGRAELRRSLREALRRHGTPAVFVTHDAEEARVMGDSVLRFVRGRSVECGPPGVVLPRGPSVAVSGVAAGTPGQRPDGSVELALGEATVRGPASLLRPAADGRLTVELPAPPDET
ncbi:MAG: ATP-binding cassette domain-containing protein [Myxococcaceae bacterium]|nr:ATP-binding cassette domain-containing protein [Myxococcaceae bacterium]MCI0672093.1 ATP-binding cassette domain-containing protein [Myxococcaceae bacterium]